jgi:hypothetical protein
MADRMNFGSHSDEYHSYVMMNELGRSYEPTPPECDPSYVPSRLNEGNLEQVKHMAEEAAQDAMKEVPMSVNVADGVTTIKTGGLQISYGASTVKTLEKVHQTTSAVAAEQCDVAAARKVHAKEIRRCLRRLFMIVDSWQMAEDVAQSWRRNTTEAHLEEALIQFLVRHTNCGKVDACATGTRPGYELFHWYSQLGSCEMGERFANVALHVGALEGYLMQCGVSDDTVSSSVSQLFRDAMVNGYDMKPIDGVYAKYAIGSTPLSRAVARDDTEAINASSVSFGTAAVCPTGLCIPTTSVSFGTAAVCPTGLCIPASTPGNSVEDIQSEQLRGLQLREANSKPWRRPTVIAPTQNIQ